MLFEECTTELVDAGIEFAEFLLFFVYDVTLELQLLTLLRVHLVPHNKFISEPIQLIFGRLYLLPSVDPLRSGHGRTSTVPMFPLLQLLRQHVHLLHSLRELVLLQAEDRTHLLQLVSEFYIAQLLDIDLFENLATVLQLSHIVVSLSQHLGVLILFPFVRTLQGSR